MRSPARDALCLAPLLATLALVAPAQAGDVQGDAYDCQELWVMRNQVYKDNAYCFASPRAITYFGNGGCTYLSEDSVPLSKWERELVSSIRQSEARQGC